MRIEVVASETDVDDRRNSHAARHVEDLFDATNRLRVRAVDNDPYPLEPGAKPVGEPRPAAIAQTSVP
jgi:hypothetical protein